jgi:acyl carrier protein
LRFGHWSFREAVCLVLTQIADFLYPVESRFAPEVKTNLKHFAAVEPPLRQSQVPSWRSVNVASVAERVTEIVAEQLGVDKEKITPETSFVNDLGADSLDTVELVMELEEEFDINIPDDAAEKIQTVGQAIKFIEEAQNS